MNAISPVSPKPLACIFPAREASDNSERSTPSPNPTDFSGPADYVQTDVENWESENNDRICVVFDSSINETPRAIEKRSETSEKVIGVESLKEIIEGPDFHKTLKEYVERLLIQNSKLRIDFNTGTFDGKEPKVFKERIIDWNNFADCATKTLKEESNPLLRCCQKNAIGQFLEKIIQIRKKSIIKEWCRAAWGNNTKKLVASLRIIIKRRSEISSLFAFQVFRITELRSRFAAIPFENMRNTITRGSKKGDEQTFCAFSSIKVIRNKKNNKMKSTLSCESKIKPEHWYFNLFSVLYSEMGIHRDDYEIFNDLEKFFEGSKLQPSDPVFNAMISIVQCLTSQVWVHPFWVLINAYPILEEFIRPKKSSSLGVKFTDVQKPEPSFIKFLDTDIHVIQCKTQAFKIPYVDLELKSGNSRFFTIATLTWQIEISNIRTDLKTTKVRINDIVIHSLVNLPAPLKKQITSIRQTQDEILKGFATYQEKKFNLSENKKKVAAVYLEEELYDPSVQF